MIGIETDFRGSILKLRTRNGDNLYWLPANTSWQFATALTHADDVKNWKRNPTKNDMPDISQADWELVNARCVGPTLIRAFDDAVIFALALATQIDIFTVYRLHPSFAAEIGELLLPHFERQAHKGSPTPQ